MWTTYYGGNWSEHEPRICIDKNGNCYLTGRTESDSGIATPGAYKTHYADSVDAFLAKFSPAGSLLWATYYGGMHVDVPNDLKTDNSGNIVLTGTTCSDTGIATAGANDPSFGGYFDAFIAKFNPSGSLLWASYFGDSGAEEGGAICFDDSGGIYIAGGTGSSSGISTIGTYQQVYGGNDDCFLAKFTSSGKLTWSTYFGGADGEGIQSICNDKSGNLYICGLTYSDTGIATPGAFQTIRPTKSSETSFLAKFSSSGSRIWGSYFGGHPLTVLAGIGIDSAGIISLGGWTLDTTGIVTKDAYKSKLSAGYGAFLDQFSSSGSRLWGTYYGGGGEVIYGMCVDNAGSIYMTGVTSSDTGIATPGAYREMVDSNGDAFLVKFSLVKCTNGTDSIFGPLEICAGQTSSYHAKKPIKSLAYSWTIDNGKILSGNNSDSVFISCPLTGTATLRINIIKPGGCIDSGTYIIKIDGPPSPLISGQDSMCTHTTTRFISTHPLANTLWSVSGGKILSGVNKDTVYIEWSDSGTITLQETSSAGCTSFIKKHIAFKKPGLVNISGPTVICPGSNVEYYGGNNTKNSVWTVRNGTLVSGQNKDTVIVKWNGSGGTLGLTQDNSSGCKSSGSLFVSAYKSPILDLGPDHTLCEFDKYLVKIDAGSGFETYRWTPTGDTTQFIIVRKHGDYFVVVSDNCGNISEDGVKIKNVCPTQIYIPNVFTPNDDGINDVFNVIGDELSAFSMNIYDRWGERVFESQDINKGWDGTYRGEKAMNGVFIYLIHYTDSNNKRQFAKGTVTLIR